MKNNIKSFEEFINEQLINESKGKWAVGKTVRYKIPKSLNWRKDKIAKELGNGRWELENGVIAYEKDDIDFVLVESFDEIENIGESHIYYLAKDDKSDKYVVRKASKNANTVQTGSYRFDNKKDADTKADELNESEINQIPGEVEIHPLPQEFLKDPRELDAAIQEVITYLNGGKERFGGFMIDRYLKDSFDLEAFIKSVQENYEL